MAGMINSITDYIGIVKIDNTEYLTGSTLFGICNTIAGTQTKTVIIEDISNFTPTHGLTIHVLFNYTNTAADPLLQIGNGVAYAICSTKHNAAGSTIANSWREGAVVSLTFIDSRYDEDNTTNGTEQNPQAQSYWLINSAMDTGADPSSTIEWQYVTGAPDLTSIENLDTQGYLKRTIDTNDNTIVTWSLDDTTFATESHTHGNITNDGKISSNGVAIADNDQLVIIDASDNSGRIAKTSIKFDGSTDSKALTQKGTWETFNNYTHPTGDGNLHVPATGTTNKGKFLKVTNNTAGSIGWASIQQSDITFEPQNANKIFAGPSSGNDATPTFRSIVAADLPAGSTTKTGIVQLSAAADDTSKAATAKSVYDLSQTINSLLAANDAMVFKGTIGDGGTINTTASTPQTLPTKNYQAGWTYRVITAGTYAGYVCEEGDLIIAINDGPTTGNSVISEDWTVAQTNIEGAVSGPVSSDDNHVAIFNGSTGKLIKDSNLTVSVDTNKFTISGGTTTSRSLTIDKTVTGIVDSSSASALGTNQKLVTERDVYYGLPTINSVHTYNSNTDIYVPTSAGTTGQYLKSSGNNTAPVWDTFGPSTVNLGNVSNNKNLNNTEGTKGDLIYWSAANTPARLTLGNSDVDGFVLTLDNGLPAWKANASTDANVKQSPLPYNDTNANKEYAILFKTSGGNYTEVTSNVLFTSTSNKRVTINPSTGTLTAAKLKGDITTNYIVGQGSGTAFLQQSGWKILGIGVTSENNGAVVTGVNLGSGTLPSLSGGTAATFDVSNGILIITAGTNAVLTSGAFPTLSLDKANLSITANNPSS